METGKKRLVYCRNGVLHVDGRAREVVEAALNALLSELLRQDEPEVSFGDFCRRVISDSGRAGSTKKDLASTLGCLDAYQGGYSWEDISYVFVQKFERWLVARGYAPNTVTKHMRNLRTLINEAVRAGYIQEGDNPFRLIRLATHKAQHRFLSPEDLGRMEGICVSGRLAHTRDAFLFCCYTGLRYSDFRRLDAGCLFMEEGLTWLRMKLKKTGTEIAVPISLTFGGKAMEVLARYESVEAFARVGSNSRVNSDLKILQQLAGIRTRITFHTSRHTCATLLCHQGVPITTVQKILGHTSVSTTQIYQDVMRDTIVCDLRRIDGRNAASPDV
jgi:site-specific recombinase XerD